MLITVIDTITLKWIFKYIVYVSRAPARVKIAGWKLVVARFPHFFFWKLNMSGVGPGRKPRRPVFSQRGSISCRLISDNVVSWLDSKMPLVSISDISSLWPSGKLLYSFSSCLLDHYEVPPPLIFTWIGFNFIKLQRKNRKSYYK